MLLGRIETEPEVEGKVGISIEDKSIRKIDKLKKDINFKLVSFFFLHELKTEVD